MRVLLDENMPLDFGVGLSGHESAHVELLGLKGLKNGELISFARSNYEALVTLDRGILYQHNHVGHTLVIVVVRVSDSKPATVNARIPDLLRVLAAATPGDLLELA